MFVLSLIAAVAGTPLRLAEAAHDMASSVAELGGGALEAPDGGVGDDSGRRSRRISRAPQQNDMRDIAPADASSAPGLRGFIVQRRADQSARSASGVPRRLAQLQWFLC